MDNVKKNKFFLLIGLKQIQFSVLDENNKILLIKKFLANSSSVEESLKILEKFLDQNILNIEKKINTHIKEIELIINYDEFLTVDVSTIHNLNLNNVYSEITSNLLLDIKNNVIENLHNYELAHMTINRFIINGKEFLEVPSNSNYDNIFFEIKFIFLKSNTLKNLKKIFLKYEILIKNFSCYDYICNFNSSNSENIFELTEKLRGGFNHKEILFINKSSKNLSFFEKFFNFFS